MGEFPSPRGRSRTLSTLQFYLERAAQSRREAEEAKLANVRDRCISAAIAWEGMAARIQRTQVYRDDYVAARAERSDARPSSALAHAKYENEQNNKNDPHDFDGAAAPDAPAAL